MHQIRYFLAVARTLNFTRAAEDCSVSQPSLTRAIQTLEAELGGELFHRERGLTHLTELGVKMLPLVQQCFDSAAAAKSLSNSLKSGSRGAPQTRAVFVGQHCDRAAAAGRAVAKFRGHGTEILPRRRRRACRPPQARRGGSRRRGSAEGRVGTIRQMDPVHGDLRARRQREPSLRQSQASHDSRTQRRKDHPPAALRVPRRHRGPSERVRARGFAAVTRRTATPTSSACFRSTPASRSCLRAWICRTACAVCASRTRAWGVQFASTAWPDVRVRRSRACS